MKTTKMIQTLTATAICFLFSAGLATAHSDHDNTRLDMQWKFSKKVESKIQARGTLEGNSYYIGLSKHEQDVLSHYNIRLGNTFTAQVDGINAQVKRTMAGIQVMDNGFMDISMKEQLPIRPVSLSSLISTGNAMNHAGHDHTVKPYEWSFGNTTQDRLAIRLGQEDVVFVGLTKFEQDLLNNYDIKIGNKFHTVVKGQVLTAERTSGGMRIMGAPSNQINM
jgi:hypothetical protein